MENLLRMHEATSPAFEMFPTPVGERNLGFDHPANPTVIHFMGLPTPPPENEEIPEIQPIQPIQPIQQIQPVQEPRTPPMNDFSSRTPPY